MSYITTCPFCASPLDKDGLSPSLSVPVEAVEAAKRYIAEYEADNPDSYEDYENHEPAMIARALLAMAGKS